MKITHLKDTPWNTAHRFAKGQNRERRGKHRDEQDRRHPHHERHHCGPAPKPVLRIGVDQETSQLTDDGRVGQTRLPACRNGLFAGHWVFHSEPILELRLPIE